MQKKISVVIPIYNGEKYIGRCLNSVLSQVGFDIGDLEILLLNDGSSDNSSKILKMYKKKHPKIIRLVHKKNQGVAKTRDMGIRLAIGKYIVFIDQDDYIDSDYCKTFYETAEEGGYDVVVGGYKRPNNQGKIIRIVRQENTEYSKKYKVSAVWAKIHRTDFLRQNKIKFYDNNYGEDIIFTINEVNRTDKIFSINYIGYNWFWNSDSVSNTKQRGLKDDIRILKLLQDMTLYIKDELDEYYVFQTGIHYLLFSGRSALRTDFNKLHDQIFHVFKKNNLSYNNNKFILFGPSGALFSTRAAISGFILLHKLNLVGLFTRIYCSGKRN